MSLSLSDDTLIRLLADDVPHGDLTTSALGLNAVAAVMGFSARQAMTVACSEEAVRLIQLAGGTATAHQPTGQRVDAGAPLLTAHGPAAALHHAWKVAQTLMECASGIATAATAVVQALRQLGLNTPVACTRKHFPGTKAVSVKAVRAGGAVMHRLGLSETLLVFSEHLALLPPADWAARLAQVKQQHPETRLVAEVANVEQALVLARLGAEVVQLEKFTPEAVAECRAALHAQGLHVCLAAAGGIQAHNAVAYARAGADVLVTSWPYSAPPADVQVRLLPQEAVA
jgi:molybdenum transport protein